MKTTVDIPEPLYRLAERSAAQRGTSLKALVVIALEHEVRATDAAEGDGNAPYFARRTLLPQYEALLKAGAFRGGTNSTEIISEERGA